MPPIFTATARLNVADLGSGLTVTAMLSSRRLTLPLPVIKANSVSTAAAVKVAKSCLISVCETTSGIVHVQQDDNELEKVRAIVDDRNDFALTGLHALTTGMGSVVLALAVAEGRLKAEEASSASLLDELFQAERWGEDPLAVERRAKLANELIQAERFLNLL